MYTPKKLNLIHRKGTELQQFEVLLTKLTPHYPIIEITVVCIYVNVFCVKVQIKKRVLRLF